MDDDQGDFDLLAASLPPIPSPSRVKRRLIESAVAIDADDPESVVYQHTLMIACFVNPTLARLTTPKPASGSNSGSPGGRSRG